MTVMVEAILPLKLSGDWQAHDLERSQMLLRSLDRCWVGKQPLRLTVIARDEDHDVICQNLSAGLIEINVVRETELLPCLSSMPAVPGWYKQQVLKLAAYQIVQAPFYLLLDADIICAQRLSDETLIVDGKALTDWEARSRHPDWWRGSAKVLDIEESPSSPGMSVTPELFSTAICLSLEQHLTRQRDNAWHFLLNQRNWTEFSLYSSFAYSQNIMFDYHHSEGWMLGNKRALRSEHSLWGADGFHNWKPQKAFLPDAVGTFVVCQSNTEILPERIEQKLNGSA